MDPGGSVFREICAAASLPVLAGRKVAAVAGSGVVERSNDRAAVAAAVAVWTCAALLLLLLLEEGLVLLPLGTLPGWYAVTKQQVARQAVSVHRNIIMLILQIGTRKASQVVAGVNDGVGDVDMMMRSRIPWMLPASFKFKTANVFGEVKRTREWSK
jgi:hypothetical protein